MKRILSSLALLIVGLFSIFVSLSPVAMAADNCRGSGALAIPTWHKYIPTNPPPDCSFKDAEEVGGRFVILIIFGVFEALLWVAGFLAVLFVAYGGFKFLTSNGEPNNISAAKTTLLNALIGLAIAILGSQVVGFIARNLA